VRSIAPTSGSAPRAPAGLRAGLHDRLGEHEALDLEARAAFDDQREHRDRHRRDPTP
jgi:hypothetical protein